MAPDTNSAKPRWIRLAPAHPPDLSGLNVLLDHYWGGPERRITGITLRIFAVNLVALVILALGIVSLGQYQSNLIRTKLTAFGQETELLAGALSGLPLETGAVQDVLSSLSNSRQLSIQVFDENARLIAETKDSYALPNTTHSQEGELSSVRILKDMVSFILNIGPDNNTLPDFPADTYRYNRLLPDSLAALNGRNALSAWADSENGIILSAAAPLTDLTSENPGAAIGAVQIIRPAPDVEQDVQDTLMNIVLIFIGALLVTLALSIYLAGTIARPLKRLAVASEAVRQGRAEADAIPDMADRKDEIGELSVALRAMIKALADRMDSIDAFAADVSHELKNPLTSLRSAVETLQKVKDNKKKRQLMDVIAHDVERIDRLISDISAMSRLDMALSREKFGAVSLRTLLHELVDSLRPPLDREAGETRTTWPESLDVKGTRIQILRNGSEQDISVFGTSIHLTQVLRNLLENALSFSNSGDVIEIDIQENKQNVRIEIRDRGPGIPPGSLDSIFERFYSQRPQAEEFGGHSGLGLSICKQIITAFGGQIFASNLTDENGAITGSMFTVILKKA